MVTGRAAPSPSAGDAVSVGTCPRPSVKTATKVTTSPTPAMSTLGSDETSCGALKSSTTVPACDPSLPASSFAAAVTESALSCPLAISAPVIA